MRSFPFLLLAATTLAACGAHGPPPMLQAAVVSPALAVAPPILRVPLPKLDGALGAKMIPATKDSVITARLTIDAHSDEKVARPPLNVALCIDTSGSMEGKPMDDARKAALAFLDGLVPGDGFSVVTFDSTARVIVPATRLQNAKELDAIRPRIEAMQAVGTTDMIDGVRLAVQQVGQLFDASRVNRVVLLGDGVPNDPSQLRLVAQQAAASGISISTMGLGLDYDEVLMGDIAQTTGGRFKYIDDSTKIASFFEEELSRISRMSARAATLQIVPGPGVVIESVVGYPLQRTANGVQISVGDVSLGGHRDVFVKLRVHGHHDGAAVELADTTLRFTASDGSVHEEHLFLGAHATTDDGKIAQSKNDDVERGAKEAQKAADTLETIRKAHDGDKGAPIAPNAPPPFGGPGFKGKPTTMPAPASVSPQALGAAKREHDDAMRAVYGD